jgi:hypothetical protein
LIASVALRVKMISRSSRALMKRWTVLRAVSNRVVAVALSQCRPRWTLEYSSVMQETMASITWRGFWALAALSR